MFLIFAFLTMIIGFPSRMKSTSFVGCIYLTRRRGATKLDWEKLEQISAVAERCRAQRARLAAPLRSGKMDETARLRSSRGFFTGGETFKLKMYGAKKSKAKIDQ